MSQRECVYCGTVTPALWLQPYQRPHTHRSANDYRKDKESHIRAKQQHRVSQVRDHQEIRQTQLLRSRRCLVQEVRRRRRLNV